GTETMTLSDYDAEDGWSGHRSTKAWYGLFNDGDLANSTDDRAALFWTEGHSYEMTDYKKWTDGYPSIKFRNTFFYGTSSPTYFSSTDFPLFRLADAYLMYAECAIRGASGTSMSTALGYVNAVRNRSNASSVAQSDLTLDFIMDERGRELNLEGHRRSDLIRFGKFTGSSYLWPWKGNTLNGTSIPDTYKLFPIPLTALEANENLTQNPGY
ncbi:MAG: RagB/SusD family nutrient uptake outer membrane protein, partial [Muricauda sp.]|nr:RagB/SusD family nutrient uptake outer membrane protein [Allomuricauda sp.]